MILTNSVLVLGPLLLLVQRDPGPWPMTYIDFTIFTNLWLSVIYHLECLLFSIYLRFCTGFSQFLQYGIVPFVTPPPPAKKNCSQSFGRFVVKLGEQCYYQYQSSVVWVCTSNTILTGDGMHVTTVISLFEAASLFKVAPPTLMSGLPQIKHQ